jgi:hypothetical protein
MNKVDLLRVVELYCNLDVSLFIEEVNLDEIKCIVYLEIMRSFTIHCFTPVNYFIYSILGDYFYKFITFSNKTANSIKSVIIIQTMVFVELSLKLHP